ncbi:MAG: hypothetical protein ACYSWU_00885 [Planctomycetota bacterium]
MNELVRFFEGRRGKENAKTRLEISGWLGCSVREVKHLAEEARLAGVPILYSTDAKSGGIFLADTGQEIEEGIDKLTRLALSILRERSALKRALKKRREKVEQRELFGT